MPQLVELQRDKNDWYARQSREILQQRTRGRPPDAPMSTPICESSSPTTPIRSTSSAHSGACTSPVERPSHGS